MKKLLILVFALIAVLTMVFAVSAADADKLTGLADVSKLYKADGSEIVGGGMNGGSYMQSLFDGGYGALYNNNVGSYIITDLNAKLPGGYYVEEIKIYHSNNSKFSLYYSKDSGKTWISIVENAQVTEATYAVGEVATQIKYVFTTCANWVASAKEIEVYGIDPANLQCLHTNLKADGWTPIPGSATCTGVGKVSQACPDCGEVLEQVSNDVLPLGHDLVTNIYEYGTNVAYGKATLDCSRCEYTIDFQGEVNLTDLEKYCSIGESQQFTNVIVSSIADLWGASRVENLFTGNWVDVGPFNTWVAAGEDDTLEYVMLNFQGAIDLTLVKVMVQNDSGATLVISALNEETGEYEVVRDLVSYDPAIGGGQTLVMEVPMLGVTTSSIKIQSFSNWRNTNGYYYNRMVIGELEVYGIAQGCGLDADFHEHAYDTLVEFVTAPTCQDAGTGKFKCACNDIVTLDIEASEEYHNYIEVEGTRIPSTCTVAGYYTGRCEYCETEATIELEFDTENGHDFSEEVGRTDPDCANAGSITYKCANCEATYVLEINALGHAYGEAVVVPSTCKDNGSSTKECTICGHKDVTTLATTGCSWTLDSVITEPTCGATGTGNYVCTVCGDTKEDTIAATGNHTWDTENYVTTLNPTCEGTGAARFTCTTCGGTKNDAIAALGHSFTVEVENSRTEPTCDTDGSVYYVCANGCEYSSVDKAHKVTLKALGHDWAEADCESPKTCKTCSAIDGEALGHDWADATCTEPKTCKTCGATDGEANGHTGGAVCDVCGTILCVATIGENKYATLEEAFANANAGDTITLVGNIELVGAGIVVDKAVTLDLNGFDIAVPNDTVGDGVFCVVAGGELTINGEGTVNALGNNDYSIAIWAKGGRVVINGGTYTNIGASSEVDGEHFDLIYVSMGGSVVINGGTFICETPEWTINSKNSEPGVCYVYGGTFEGFNPNANKDGEDFIPVGYTATATDNTYTVAACTAHEYDNGARNEEDTGYIYTCTLCGTSYTTYTKGTTQEPIEAVVGENTVVIYNTEAGEIWYYLPVTGYGKYTITVDASVGFKYGTSPKAMGRMPFTSGQTTYEFVVDSDDSNQIALAFTSNVETFTVAYEAMEYPTVVLGSNTITATGMGIKYVIDAYGNVIISNPEGSNAVITVGYNSIIPGESIEITIADGETVKIAVSTYDGSESAEVTIILHVHEYNRPVWDETTESTCTTAGKEVWACECGETEITYLPIDPNAHPFDNIENFTYVDSTCDEYGYEEFYCSACEQNIHIDYEELGAHDFNDNGICEVCGANAKGTTQAPIVVTIGENTFYVVDGVSYTLYKVDVIYDLGKLVITVNEDALVAPGFFYPPYGSTFEDEALTGQTSYEITIDNEKCYGEYYFAIANCDTFTVAYEEQSRPQLVEGPNAIEVPLDGWWAAEVIYVVKVPGNYVLSLADGETNACVTLVGEFFNDRLWLDEEPYSFTVAEGETVKFFITTDNWEADTIDLVLTKEVDEHIHTEVEIPAVLPLPSNGHTYTTAGVKCSECGEIIVAPETKVAGTSSDANFKINSANLSLGEDITITYDATHPANSSVDSMYMVFIVNGRETIVDTFINHVSGNRYSFNFKDIKSYEMADNIEAYVYAVENGAYVMKSHLQYSIMQYCVNQLKKSPTAAFKQLIFDVLYLGECSQKVKGHNTNALVTDLVEDAVGYELKPTIVTTIDSSYNVQALTGDRTQGYDWKSGQLSFGSSVEIVLDFTADSLDNLVLSFAVGNRTIEIDASEAELVSGNRYSVKFQVKVAEYANTITCNFIKDGVQTGSTLTYSIYTYIVRNYTTASHGTNMLNFMKSIYAYAEAAKLFAAEK